MNAHDFRSLREVQARRRAQELEIDDHGIPRSNDPLVLAGVISRNRTAIDQGWQELERLNRRLQALEAASPSAPEASAEPVAQAQAHPVT